MKDFLSAFLDLFEIVNPLTREGLIALAAGLLAGVIVWYVLRRAEFGEFLAVMAFLVVTWIVDSILERRR